MNFVILPQEMKDIRINLVLIFFILTNLIFGKAVNPDQGNAPVSLYPEENTYVDLSLQLLKAARDKTPWHHLAKELSQASFSKLSGELQTDEEKKAFWINIYNAYIQLILSENPSLYEDRGKFFTEDRIVIAGRKLSFDDIEHGMIRGSKIKLSFGFLKDPFVSTFERKLRVKETDGRIHFALNCGAVSCPYVSFYTASQIDEQLDEASKRFLNRTSRYEKDEKEVWVTPLFSWFRADFGGKSGILNYLKKYGIIPPESYPSIEFKDYDWTLDLGNFQKLNEK